MIDHPTVPSVLPSVGDASGDGVIDHHMVPNVLPSVGMHEDME